MSGYNFVTFHTENKGMYNYAYNDFYIFMSTGSVY